MKTRHFLIRTVSFLALASASFLAACSGNEPEFGLEASYAREEAQIDAYYADADDMAGVAVSQSDETEGARITSGARELEINDDRFCDVSVEVDVDLSSLLGVPVGDITIDFNTGCTDGSGNVRKGEIKIHFQGRRFRPASFIAITFQDYEINGVKLNGTRTLTNLAASTVSVPKFQIELVNGSVEWDGKIATREHCFTGTWDRGIILAPGDDRLIVSQCADADVAAAGKNANGIAYKMEIEEGLVYKRGCPLAVSGIKRFTETKTGKEIIIDYGRGSCDSDIAITVNGNIHRVR